MPSGVTADALPTVQIDGVVWSQAIVGNTVYAGGSFANARPAGAAPGTLLTPRSNLLSYNLSTGTLNTSFDPDVNGVIKSVVASPDGSRVYIGGQFTSIDGVAAYRIAAFDTATGARIPSFRPVLNAGVNSLSVTNTTVYAGGVFGPSHLAAFSGATGALLAWNPTANGIVDAVQLTPDGKHLIVGGAFDSVNGAPALGITSIDSTTGTMIPFAVNEVVKDYGSGSAILSLSTDGVSIFGAGYHFGSGNFEGVFSANPTTGAINWLADCHGDSYGAYSSGSQVYVVSHEYTCTHLGGFRKPTEAADYQRTTAFTTDATGANLANTQTGGYGNFVGQPSPSMINWFPTLAAGTYTKQYQAAWTVTGNGKYVVEGGEFPSVNGTPQQGLVRFAIPSLAPNKRGPMDTAAGTTTPTATVVSGTAATITWPTNWDQDNDRLTYRLMRSGSTAPVYTTTAVSQFWNRPTLTYTDTGLSPGMTYKYTVYTSDADGNTVHTAPATITTSSTLPAPTSTTLAASPAAPVAGQAVTVAVSVQTTTGGKPTDGTVTVTIDGRAAPTLSLDAAGTAKLNLGALAPGSHTVVATYAGDMSFAPSSTSAAVPVAKDSTAVSATVSPAAPVAGQALSVRSTVRTLAPGTLTATGTVTVAVDGRARPPTTLTTTGATTALPGLQPGQHTITVQYSGDASAAPLSTSTTVTVSKAAAGVTAAVSRTTPVVGQSLSVRSTVRTLAPGTLTATGTVTVAVDGRARPPTTLTTTGATTALPGLQRGRHTITVRYSGDATHTAATTSNTVTVAAGRVTARVTSSKPTTYAHRLIRLTASVRAAAPAAGTPNGSVVYYVDGHKRVTRTLHSGAATYSVRLPKGRHRITIRYTGSHSYYAVTSAAITQRER